MKQEYGADGLETVNKKIVETSLSLGSSGYRTVRQVENVLRFDHAKATGDAVPSVSTLLKQPDEVPLLLTPDGTLWQPADFGNRMVSSMRAIAELFGVPYETPLDEIYQKIAAAVDDKSKPA
jgi:hypothetical protein